MVSCFSGKQHDAYAVTLVCSYDTLPCKFLKMMEYQ